MQALDFRAVLLEDFDIVATAKKQAMCREASARGYSQDSIHLAVNRFNRFWVALHKKGQFVRSLCAKEDSAHKVSVYI